VLTRRSLMIALAVLFGGASFSQLSAQNITGTWQGTLAVGGGDLRAVFKISTGDNDKLKGLFYSIDQSPQAIPVNPVTVQGSSVKLTIPALAGDYEGKLSADASSITGTWTQPGIPPIPMTLNRATPQTAWAIPEPPSPPKPMAANAKLAFEVATIKPSDPSAAGKLFTMRGREFLTMNTSLSDMVVFAYGIHAKQIINAPAWVETDKFDVTGKPEGEGQPNLDQYRVMIQKLLADRFKLTFHRDKKELSVYTILIGKNGPKLTKSEGDPNDPPSLLFRGLGMLPAQNASMAEFAGVMQSAVLDKPVLDQTGLTGKFDFTLSWMPDEFQFAGLGVRVPPPGDPRVTIGPGRAGPPDLFTAFQEQLGLKLESTRAPAEVFVIDRVEKPSEN
jgi:uncharacterized protein (TIGR03435 family)